MRVSYKGMSRAAASYKAYEKHYNEWKHKGYHMEGKLSYKEYRRDVYERGIKFGLKNIAREAASNARSWRKSEVNKIVDRLYKKYKEEDEKFDISFKISKKEILNAKKKILKYSRKELFKTLAGTNYEYKEEAEAVIYG